MNKHKYEVILEDIKPDMPQGTLKVICHPENLKVETLRKLLRDKDIGKNIDVTLVNEVDA